MKVESRLAVVEEKIERTEENVDKMMTNHLPHIAKEINKINTNFKVYKAKSAVWTSIFVFIATVLSQILIKLFI